MITSYGSRYLLDPVLFDPVRFFFWRAVPGFACDCDRISRHILIDIKLARQRGKQSQMIP